MCAGLPRSWAHDDTFAKPGAFILNCAFCATS